ncbi:2-phosphosulfolactate phosphatase [Bacillus horti]|nr:2-phosphosulfolactate phosphatase [Bacillus horti]
MKIDVALSTSYLKQEDIHNKTVIVIDTLRTGSTIITALHKGAAKIIPVETIGQALHYFHHEDTYLCGERFCKKVNGFDLGSSPFNLLSLDTHNKTLIITSTNGTKAILKARKASHLLVGCLLNAQHCIEHALNLKKDITLLCAGSRGEFALEDGLTAGYMLHLLKQFKENLQLTDLAQMLRIGYEENKEMLNTLVQTGSTALRLLETDQEDDLHYCLQMNSVPLTGIYQGEEIVALK